METGRATGVAELIEQALEGRPRAVARLISRVEEESPQLREIARALAPHGGRAHVIGITGSPGVGKSTSTAALIGEFRKLGKSVAVLAVDPSSPFTGGALLGDRIRMEDHSTDAGVFIRSMASRGHLGGLSWATPQAVRVLDAAGFDVVLIETVGVGQSEVEVAAMADTTLVLLAPGMGDGIQAAKAGILEIGDIFVINKADRDGAAQTRRELRSMVAQAPRVEGAWKPPIQLTVASKGEGVAELVGLIVKHHAHLSADGGLERRRAHRARTEVEAIAVGKIRARLGDLKGHRGLDDVAASVARGETDPFSAADALLDSIS